jgi:hypothetical protein
MSKQPVLTPRPGVGRCASSLAEAARTVPLPSNTMLNLIDFPSLSARVEVTYGQAMKTPFANPLHGSEPYSVKKVRHIAALASRSVTSDHRPVGISHSADQPEGVGAQRSHKVELLWQNWLYAVGRSTVPMFQLTLA